MFVRYKLFEDEMAKKAVEEQQTQQVEKKDLYSELYGDIGTGAGVPKELPERGPPPTGGPRPPGYVPPLITNCPQCSTVMTFSPDGGMFCIRCGYKPEK